MKKFNLRNFASIVMVSLAMVGFTACGDKEEPFELPKIEFDQQTLSLEKGASTQTLQLTSNREWAITVDGENADWITVTSATTGANNATVTFTVAANDGQPRTAKVLATIKNSTRSAVCTVSQAGGIEIKYTSLTDLKAMYKDADVTITDQHYIKVSITSDATGGNSTSKKNLMVSDGITGISFRLTSDPAGDWKVGDEIQVDCKDAVLTVYGGMPQLGLDEAKMTKLGTKLISYSEITASQLLSGDYDGLPVAVKGVQFAEEYQGKAVGSASAHTTTHMVDASGNKFAVFVAKYANFVGYIIPAKSGVVKGIVNVNNAVRQLLPQTEADFAGITEAPLSVAKFNIDLNGNKNVTSAAGSFAVKLTSTVAWTLTVDDAAAFSATPTSGTGDADITINYTANTADASRSCKVSITTTSTEIVEANRTISFDIVQEGAVTTNVTVAQVVSYFKSQNVASGSTIPLAAAGSYMTGIVAANNEFNNLNNMISVVDGTGAANTGILIYDSNVNGVKFKVGDKVKVKLAAATCKNYSGLREIMFEAYDNDITVESQGASFTTPEITPAQLNSDEYQGMYVKVKGVQSNNAEGTVWNDQSNNNINTKLVNAAGDVEIVVRNYKTVPWAADVIKKGVVADICGVAQMYITTTASTVQFFPNKAEDVAAFKSDVAPVESDYLWTAAKDELGISNNLETAPNGEKTLNGLAWNFAMTSSTTKYYLGFDTQYSKGIQIGSSGNYCTAASLETVADFKNAVSSVKVSAATGSNGTAKMKVYVNGTQVGDEVALGIDAAAYEFKPASPVTGKVKIEFTNTAKAFYIKSIAIN